MVNLQFVPTSWLRSALKCSPCTVMTVPPCVGPALGAMVKMLGIATYWNCNPASVKSCLFTETSTVVIPAFSDGDAQTICVAVRVSAATGVAPNRHTARPVDGKFTPSTVTRVPPVTEPRTGYTEVTLGGGMYANFTSYMSQSAAWDCSPIGTTSSACAGT